MGSESATSLLSLRPPALVNPLALNHVKSDGTSRVDAVVIRGKVVVRKTLMMPPMSENDTQESYNITRNICHRRMDTEVRMLQQFGAHPHIVSLEGEPEVKGDMVTFYMPRSPMGTLLDLVRDNSARPVPECELLVIMAQLCEALRYLHSHGVTHQDLKCENILVQSIHPMHVQIADFGYAQEADIPSVERTGSAQYLPPEKLCGEYLPKPSDIFSLGATMVSIATGSFFWRVDNQQMLSRSGLLERRLDLSMEFKQLLGAMTSDDPQQRPNIEQILDHQLLKPYLVDRYVVEPPRVCSIWGQHRRTQRSSSTDYCSPPSPRPMDVDIQRYTSFSSPSTPMGSTPLNSPLASPRGSAGPTSPRRLTSAVVRVVLRTTKASNSTAIPSSS